jgi:hypothetical protein
MLKKSVGVITWNLYLIRQIQVSHRDELSSAENNDKEERNDRTYVITLDFLATILDFLHIRQQFNPNLVENLSLQAKQWRKNPIHKN